MGRRIRERAWRDFERWCRGRGLRALPAHPWTVAAYLRWCEPRHRVTTIVKTLRVIARAHLLDCRKPPDRHPTVKRTLRRIEARWRSRGDRAALFRAEDFTGEGTVRVAKPAADAKTGRRAWSPRATPRLVSRRPAEE